MLVYICSFNRDFFSLKLRNNFWKVDLLVVLFHTRLICLLLNAFFRTLVHVVDILDFLNKFIDKALFMDVSRFQHRDLTLLKVTLDHRDTTSQYFYLYWLLLCFNFFKSCTLNWLSENVLSSLVECRFSHGKFNWSSIMQFLYISTGRIDPFTENVIILKCIICT